MDPSTPASQDISTQPLNTVVQPATAAQTLQPVPPVPSQQPTTPVSVPGSIEEGGAVMRCRCTGRSS